MKQAPETETIDRLFLELSQFTTAKTWTQLQLEAKLQVQATRILELEAALSPYATADYLTTQQQGIAHRALKIGGKDFDNAMKKAAQIGLQHGAKVTCPRCKGDGDSTVGGLACETCGGAGKV